MAFAALVFAPTVAACSGESFDLFAPTTPTMGPAGGTSSVATSGAGGGGGSPRDASGPVTGSTVATGSGGSPGSAGSTGSGGSAGSGGEAGAGSGGAVVDAAAGVDVVPPQSACTGRSRKVNVADLFISDFENGDLHGWYDFGASGPLHKIAIASPGAVGT